MNDNVNTLCSDNIGGAVRLSRVAGDFAMDHENNIFDVEVVGETVVITPKLSLTEFDFAQIENEGKRLLTWIQKQASMHILIDLKKSDYFCSTAIGTFMRWWRSVRTKSGRMAMCNLSAHAAEIVHISQLDRIWHISDTRDDGLRWLATP